MKVPPGVLVYTPVTRRLKWSCRMKRSKKLLPSSSFPGNPNRVRYQGAAMASTISVPVKRRRRRRRCHSPVARQYTRVTAPGSAKPSNPFERVARPTKQ